MRRLNQISRTYLFESTKISIWLGACKMRRLNQALLVLYSAANDLWPEMIPDVDSKWSRWKKENGMEFGFPDFFYFFNFVFLYLWHITVTSVAWFWWSSILKKRHILLYCWSWFPLISLAVWWQWMKANEWYVLNLKVLK